MPRRPTATEACYLNYSPSPLHRARARQLVVIYGQAVDKFEWPDNAGISEEAGNFIREELTEGGFTRYEIAEYDERPYT